jgi:hypothetical protein
MISILTVGKIRSPAEKTSKILGWHNTLFFEDSTPISRVKEMKNTDRYAPKRPHISGGFFIQKAD